MERAWRKGKRGKKCMDKAWKCRNIAWIKHGKGLKCDTTQNLLETQQAQPIYRLTQLGDIGFPYALYEFKLLSERMKQMDILIRGVEVAYVKEIERKAATLSKELGKSFSRTEYLKMLIQNDCELRLMEKKEKKFNLAVDELLSTLDNQESKLQEFIDSNNRLFHFMSSGVDIDDVNLDELDY